MAGHRDDGTVAEDKAHDNRRKVDRSYSSRRFDGPVMDSTSGEKVTLHGKCSHCDTNGPVTLYTAYNRDAELCPTCAKLYDEDRNK